MTNRNLFTETGILRALDPAKGLGFFQRFQYRVLSYLLALSVASSVVAGVIYYTRQIKFVEAEQTRRGSTLISNLAGQSELGAYSGDSTFLFGPARRAFQEDDVSFVIIYNRKGEPLIKMAKPGSEPQVRLPAQLLAQLVSSPAARPRLQRREDFDDLLAPIASVPDDPEAGLFGTPADTPSPAILGVARLGLSRLPARKKLDEVLRWGSYLALIVLAMGTAAALLLAHRISQPIMALARGADAVRQGELGYQLELKRTDELGLMAESFNRMSAALKQNVESLAHLNRHLEQEVASRTADLRRSRDFVALLNAPLQLEKLLDRALNALVQQTEARAGAIFLAKPVQMVVSWGVTANAFGDTEDGLPASLAHVVQRGRPVVVDPPPPLLPLTRECPAVHVLLCVPVIFREHLEAFLVLGLPAAPSSALVDFVGHAASELAIAVANARAFAAAEGLAEELERRNVALLQQRDQLLEVSRLKSEFLASVSHELRTPLNAILGYTELLSEQVYGPMNAQQGEGLAGITENARNLVTLINQVLDLSRVEAGRMHVKPKEVDLNQLVRDAVHAAAPLIRERPYKVVAELEPGALRVITDPTLVRQIVLNLLSNAIKFTEQGSVQIRAWGTPQDDVRIEVRDTGIGIRPEHLGLIFDEFRQLDGSSTRQHGGTGLGLALSKKFAGLLEGDILVESTYGQGSTFTLLLRGVRVSSVGAEGSVPASTSMGETNAR